MRRKLTIMLVTAAVIALIVATAASSMLPTYDNTLKAEERIYDRMGKAELLETMKTEFAEAMQNSGIDALIPIASVFHQRRNEFSADELIKMIEDDSLDSFLRVTVVQVLSELNGFDKADSRISQLLEKDLPKDVRQTLVTYFGNKGGIEVDKLAEIAMNVEEDEDIAFHAIKKLHELEPQRAYALSKSVLENYGEMNEGQIKAAIRVFSELDENIPIGSTIKSSSMDADNELMMKVVDAVLNGKYKSTTKDSVIFSIIDMHTYEGMKYLLEHNQVDETMRKATIDGNYHTLISILENDPNEEQIEFAIKCMEIWPINEVAQPLEKAIALKTKIVSKNLTTSRITDVMQKIKTEGVSANPKLIN